MKTRVAFIHKRNLFKKRRSIYLTGLSHGIQPFPLASRKGHLITTSAIHGVDPKTGALPDDEIEQIQLAFKNLANTLNEAGGSMGDVTQILITLSSLLYRVTVNEIWCEYFPDVDSRPSRNTTERELSGGLIISLIAVGWIP